MPAYLQPLAFVSSGVVQPDLEAEPAITSTVTGLGFPQPAAAGSVFDEGEPAATSTAAGLGFPQPAAAGLGFEAASTDPAASSAGLRDGAAAEAAALSAAEIPAHPGLGFAPPSPDRPSCSVGMEDADPPEPGAVPAGLGYDSVAAAQSSGEPEQRAGQTHQDAPVPPSANTPAQPGLASQGTRVHCDAGRSAPAGDAAAAAKQLNDSLAAWVDRHVDAAAATEFKSIAGVALHTLLLRGLAR